MGHERTYYELLDIPKFASPSVSAIQALSTASSLLERLTGRAFMSYSKIWPRLQVVVNGLATDQYIRNQFSTYQDEWKNKAVQDAVRLLRDHVGGKGRWYRVATAPSYVLGCWFKASIKGYWAVNGKVYAVLANCRKGQPLDRDDILFLARGIYELHCIDDPNNPIALIIDLGRQPRDIERVARIYEVPVEEAVSLESFEYSVREFLMASHLAGISQPPPPDVPHILDLFRR